MFVSKEMATDLKRRLKYPVHLAKILKLYEGDPRLQPRGVYCRCPFCSEDTLSLRAYPKSDEAPVMAVCQNGKCRVKVDALDLIKRVYKHRQFELTYQMGIKIALHIEKYV